MKAQIISQNTKRKTAMIIVKYDDNGCKRSATRHCQHVQNGQWRGYILDVHQIELEAAQIVSEILAAEINAMNRELEIKAKKADPYTASLLFEWRLDGDNTAAYDEQMVKETSAARKRIASLSDEADSLRARVEIARAAKREKIRKVVLLGATLAAFTSD